jgi:hypothetical protein
VLSQAALKPPKAAGSGDDGDSPGSDGDSADDGDLSGGSYSSDDGFGRRGTGWWGTMVGVTEDDHHACMVHAHGERGGGGSQQLLG